MVIAKVHPSAVSVRSICSICVCPSIYLLSLSFIIAPQRKALSPTLCPSIRLSLPGIAGFAG